MDGRVFKLYREYTHSNYTVSIFIAINGYCGQKAFLKTLLLKEVAEMLMSKSFQI